ncbi:SOS response-associated peptidase [Chitinimonas lacunae]|uniref:Abasic site processing protein n=1 Tax=Chitinimonas lacunae TaxID=1963018 RepID=A0ABV8MN19_9NEIS
MCTHFRPSSAAQILDRFGLAVPAQHFKTDVYPGYLAPIVRLDGDRSRQECVGANFGLIPPWARDNTIGRKTYNARSETVAEKPSYRAAWKRRQFCLVPMQGFFEPNYESGRAVSWCIARRDQADFAVAGIWERWVQSGGEPVLSFSLLTINADGHPLMGRFHKPGDEKRSLVVVSPDQYEAWLESDTEVARSFFGLDALKDFDGAPASSGPYTPSLI